MNVTLICLPFAGASAAVYREWGALLPSWIRLRALDLPGHGAKRAQPALQCWPDVADALGREALRAIDGPFAIFGYSMGALAGLELAHWLYRTHGLMPVWFGAAACAAPSCRTLDATWLDCTDEAMVDELRRLGATPEELLDDRGFLDLALPVLRADFHLCATYVRPSNALRAPLTCPLMALVGRDDTLSEQPENLSAWTHETSGRFTQRVFDGGHFFIDTARAELIDAIVASLAATLPHAASANPLRQASVAHLCASSAVSRTASTDSAGASGPRGIHS
ncbi:thioesterase II family protein [Caballeronia sp. KNU42]